MFKKPFNKDKGETRTCRNCNKEFYTQKPRWKCSKCINEVANESRLKRKAEGKILANKESYPFSTKNNEAIKRFASIKRRLAKAWSEGPEAVKRHYERQFREMEEFGILVWINDRRTKEAVEERKQKKGRPMDDIRKELPSTKNMPYEI